MTPLSRLKPIWPALVFWLVLALMPIGRASALAMLIMLIGGIALAIRQPAQLFKIPTIKTFHILFACFWIPIAVSTLDAYKPDKALSTTIAMLRFLPVGWFAIWSLRDPRRREWLSRWICYLILIWCIDALVQALVGTNLLGMAHPEDRLNGIFDDNLKLGPVLAGTCAIALDYARRNWHPAAAISFYGLMLTIVLLAGTRSAWIMFGVVTACFLLLHLQRHGWRSAVRPALGIGALGAILLTTAYALSPTFEERINRSLLIFEGGRTNVDAAVSIRLPIWETSVAMASDHWVNGVGVRSFRYAYENFAEPDDPWLVMMKERGAYHAHQLVLEAATETGLLGVIGWVLFVVVALRYSWRLPSAARRVARPFAFALVAMLFPINSHFAFYSTFWSLLFWWLVIGWLALSATSTDDAPGA